MLQSKLHEVKEANEKLVDENAQLSEIIQGNKKAIKTNEKLQKQNRELEATLEGLKAEISKMNTQSKDLQRACTRLRTEKDELSGTTNLNMEFHDTNIT